MPFTQHGDSSTSNIENFTDVGGDQVKITNVKNVTNVTYITNVYNGNNGISWQTGKSSDRFGEQNGLSFGKWCLDCLQSGYI